MATSDGLQEKQEQKAGLKCPQCGTFIETSIMQLLAGIPLRCSNCNLTLNMDRMKSSKALSTLQKIRNAKVKVDQASRFNK